MTSNRSVPASVTLIMDLTSADSSSPSPASSMTTSEAEWSTAPTTPTTTLETEWTTVSYVKPQKTVAKKLAAKKPAAKEVAVKTPAIVKSNPKLRQAHDTSKSRVWYAPRKYQTYPAACNFKCCPVLIPGHGQGLYQHQGLPGRYSIIFGTNNPPPEIWDIASRYYLDQAEEWEKEEMHGFMNAHVRYDHNKNGATHAL